MFKSKEFARFARRARIANDVLCDAIARAERGLIDARLGGGLIKQRVAQPGSGRSSGYRTLIAYHARERSVFVYGFPKSERGNIEADELMLWRRVAAAVLAMPDGALETAIERDEMMEINCDDEN